MTTSRSAAGSSPWPSNPAPRANIREASSGLRCRTRNSASGWYGTPGGIQRGRPVMAALDLLGRRWTLRILWELSRAPAGFRELQRRCERMSSSVLSTRLDELTTARLTILYDDGYRLTPRPGPRRGARPAQRLEPPLGRSTGRSPRARSALRHARPGKGVRVSPIRARACSRAPWSGPRRRERRRRGRP
ncbi:winged helix-turn-helix transcriptional regulator [Nonomuraea thailandensis]